MAISFLVLRKKEPDMVRPYRVKNGQLIGIIADRVAASELALTLGETLNLTADQIGLKAGMLVNTIFPIIGTVFVILAIRHFNRERSETAEK